MYDYNRLNNRGPVEQLQYASNVQHTHTHTLNTFTLKLSTKHCKENQLRFEFAKINKVLIYCWASDCFQKQSKIECAALNIIIYRVRYTKVNTKIIAQLKREREREKRANFNNDVGNWKWIASKRKEAETPLQKKSRKEKNI